MLVKFVTAHDESGNLILAAFCPCEALNPWKNVDFVILKMFYISLLNAEFQSRGAHLSTPMKWCLLACKTNEGEAGEICMEMKRKANPAD